MLDFPRLQVRPCIAEFLRTGCRPPELRLRVERVIEVPVAIPLHTHDEGEEDQDGRPEATALYKAYRMFLSDGEHTIQALLKSQLHALVSHTDELAPGTVLDIEDYELRAANRVVSGGGSRQSPGTVVFLAVGRYSPVEPGTPDHSGSLLEQGEDFANGRFDRDDGLSARPEKRQRTASVAADEASPARTSSQRDRSETRTGNATNTPIPHDTPGAASSHLPPKHIEDQEIPRCRSAGPMIAPSTKAKHVVEPSRKILALSDLLFPLTPLPRRNHICSVIAVVSWISPEVIKRTYMPPKRDLRLIDPSIVDTIDQRRSSTAPSSLPSSLPPSRTANGTLGISMSVFVDAAKFHPPVGTVALFRGLKTHEWDGISLNAYEKDCRNKEWFVTDPARLAMLGVDASALKTWWLETQKRWEDARKI
ncbi:hypothetical protein MaudCBS49596_006705 [Microsporum audouinii]